MSTIIMSVKELTDDLRSLGVKTCEQTERACIINGKYPFAFGVNTGKSRVFRIYKKKYLEWRKENFNV